MTAEKRFLCDTVFNQGSDNIKLFEFQGIPDTILPEMNDTFRHNPVIKLRHDLGYDLNRRADSAQRHANRDNSDVIRGKIDRSKQFRRWPKYRQWHRPRTAELHNYSGGRRTGQLRNPEPARLVEISAFMRSCVCRCAAGFTQIGRAHV